MVCKALWQSRLWYGIITGRVRPAGKTTFEAADFPERPREQKQKGGADMSVADTIFINMCRDVIENGTSTEGEKVRPVWEDGTPAYTIKKFGVVNRYDLRKEFPALTLRKTALKSAMDEILSGHREHGLPDPSFLLYIHASPASDIRRPCR